VAKIVRAKVEINKRNDFMINRFLR